MSRRRVVLGVCAIGAGTLLLSGCDGFRAASSQFSDDTGVQQKVTAVRLETGSGSVRIKTGAQPTIHRTVFYVSDKPGQTFRFEGDTLVLEDCKRRNCSVDYDVTLPAGAKVMGEVGSGEVEITAMTEVGVEARSGDVRVRDVPGPVTVNVSSGRAELSGLAQSAVVEAGSGDVVMSNVKGDVTVLSRSGEVDASGIGGKASIDSSSGDVKLTMASAQNAKVTASSGNILIRVPRGNAYKLDARTNSGERNVNIDTSPSSASVLQLNASSGDITVDYS
ncbi:hypothetical protein JOF56_002391 [Kibdelosporangium banguiense]|uniref:DUF4097 domain-containing protein n=1 Tax=Kibdelosporangium banguiense TaxID=1365924 RepID=A0ABS4TC49_9PSEU|nr:DUF4097 family beta strand repeat-containing protein [Kibdelosporangium banguiense]MBP2322006.1 hypothetical protein [Kibdelosporangium banguiense]